MPYRHRNGPRRHHKLRIDIALLFAATVLASTSTNAQTSVGTLMQDFQDPPAAARPMVRWWWFGPAVQKPEILRELQQMKADGIGGVELAFVYPETLEGNLEFLTPEMLNAVHYAQTEARTLGLRVDVTLCSGWPYGGPHIPLEQAATRLRTVEVLIPADSRTIPVPKLAEGESLLSAAIVIGTPTPQPARGTPAPLNPPPSTWDAATAQPLTLPNRATSLSFTASAPEKPHVALFFIQSHTRQQVKRAAVGAEGFVLDPFSREAVATHLKAVGEPLLSAFPDAPPYAIFSDSLEAYGADWTPTLPAEFLKRRGYDLLPHLPELVAGGTPAAENVRHDYGRTLTELVNENYLIQINQWALAHHTKFRSQTYGEPAVSFSSQKLAGLPEGEGPQWRAFSTLRWASSANHVFGNTVTSGETFTWLHSPVFRATPLDMKAEADIDFLMGENQLIFHGWPYSPPASQLPPGDPGWSLYAAAVFNDHNPWHPVMPAVTRYITRISALLRQGQPANQVAILLPTDDAWATFSPGHSGQVSVTGAMQRLVPREIIAAILSAGYNVDFIDAEAINSVGLAKYQLLVIPPTDRIPESTSNKIAQFEANGGKVVGVGRAPSLDPQGKPVYASNPLFHSAAAILVPEPRQLGDALHRLCKPDFALATPNDQIGFIRRHMPDSDLYFVVNTSNQTISTSVTFGTTHGGATAFDPETGNAGFASANNWPLTLAPYESRIFVFGPPGPRPPATGPRLPAISIDLSTNWQLTFTGTNKTQAQPTLTDWSADPATLHYSGEAVYTRDFTLQAVPRDPVFLAVDGGKPLPGDPATTAPEHVLLPSGLPDPRVTRTGTGMHAFYDPPIREAALVTLNGQPAGALWHPPYRLDVTTLLKPGPNHIEIHVFNTALNAWAAIPPRDYKPLIAKYGDRFQMQDLDKVEALPSGILGTIHLITQPTP